jgi:predicted enzyme related to lactoylglutathione lyase
MGAPMNYTTFKAGNTGGGFPDVDGNNPAGRVLVYISSDDIEADLKKAEKLGGKQIMGKTEVPGIGWFGIFNDPTGNPVAVFKAMPM